MATITKLTNKNGDISYRIRAVKGKTKSGNSKQVSMMWKPSANMTTKQTEKELDRVVRDFEESITKGRFVNSNILFKDYSNDWLYKKQHLAPSTYQDYKNTINRLNNEFGFCKVSEISSLMVIKFYEKLRKVGENKNNSQKGLSEKTIKNIHTCLCEVFEYAIDDEIIYKNPLKSKNFPKPKPPQKEMKFLDNNDLEQLFQEFNNLDISKKVYILLSLSTGMRVGEISALEWKDIDFENKIIKVDKTLQYISDIGIIEKQPKTNKAKRIINIEQNLLDFLCEYREKQKQDIKLLDYYWHYDIELKDEKGKTFIKKNDKLFTQFDGKPIFPDTFGKWLKRFRKKHNLKDYTPHSFRHTFATISIEENQSISAISETLGHAKKSTTLDMYVHSNNIAKEQLANSISSKLNNYFLTRQD
ncbi:MAG: tyrosine-type recombinase/integrase [Bacilli bacterium]|nr:tyrosine-type recombinase/integrase [Bacilli bacterium]MDD4718605.1 tyrosine-type recombinase/integrase [Bacilli bacterium]